MTGSPQTQGLGVDNLSKFEAPACLSAEFHKLGARYACLTSISMRQRLVARELLLLLKFRR
jgi:hypothetical protein